MIDIARDIVMTWGAMHDVPLTPFRRSGLAREAFGTLLSQLGEDTSLGASTFSNECLALMFIATGYFNPSFVVTIGAYHGLGASSLSLAAMTLCASDKDHCITDVLCEPDKDCGPFLNKVTPRNRAILMSHGAATPKARYVSKTTHLPAPEVVETLEISGRFVALIDLDSLEDGKARYTDTAHAILQQHRHPGLLFFHDVCVPKFRSQIDRLSSALSSRGINLFEMPIDDCGLGLAYLPGDLNCD